MVQISCLFGLCGIAIVAAQVTEHQSQEIPWAHLEHLHQYEQPVQKISNRQGIINGPEAASIAAVAVGGVVGLGGVSVGLANANTQRQELRRDLNQAIEQESETCTDVREIRNQVSALVDVVVLALESFLPEEKRKRSAQDVFARQATPEAVVQRFRNIKSALPTVDCR